MPQITSSINIDCPVLLAYQVAKEEQEKFSEFMEDIESVKIIDHDEISTVTEWIANIEDIPLFWTERDEFDDQNLLITWMMIEGDLEIYNGAWKFDETDEGTKSTIIIEYDFGMPSLTDLIGATLQEKIRNNAEMMLRGIKKYCEEKYKIIKIKQKSAL